MFKYLLVAVLIAFAVADDSDKHAEIKLLKSDVRADGYDYALETSNNIQASAAGDVHGNVRGDFSWVDPQGVHIKVSYVADENGYQPVSDVLPTPPPTPPEILKALEYIRSHPPAPEPLKLVKIIKQ